MSENDSNFRETEQSVYGLGTRAQAESIRELTERSLKLERKDADHSLRVEERTDGTFDVIVLKRVN